MNPGIIFRLIIFFTTITLLAVLIAWMAQTSWRRTGDLHEQLSEKQWKSFQIADHLQQTVLSLNNLVLRFAAYRNTEDWTNFEAVSAEVSHHLSKGHVREVEIAEQFLRKYLPQNIGIGRGEIVAANGAGVQAVPERLRGRSRAPASGRRRLRQTDV